MDPFSDIDDLFDDIDRRTAVSKTKSTSQDPTRRRAERPVDDCPPAKRPLPPSFFETHDFEEEEELDGHDETAPDEPRTDDTSTQPSTKLTNGRVDSIMVSLPDKDVIMMAINAGLVKSADEIKSKKHLMELIAQFPRTKDGFYKTEYIVSDSEVEDSVDLSSPDESDDDDEIEEDADAEQIATKLKASTRERLKRELELLVSSSASIRKPDIECETDEQESSYRLRPRASLQHARTKQDVAEKAIKELDARREASLAKRRLKEQQLSEYLSGEVVTGPHQMIELHREAFAAKKRLREEQLYKHLITQIAPESANEGHATSDLQLLVDAANEPSGEEADDDYEQYQEDAGETNDHEANGEC